MGVTEKLVNDVSTGEQKKVSTLDAKPQITKENLQISPFNPDKREHAGVIAELWVGISRLSYLFGLSFTCQKL